MWVQEAWAAPQDTTRASPREVRQRERDLRRLERDTTRAALFDSLAADSLTETSVPFPDPDSVMRLLMERSGYRPVIYRGDTLRFSSKDRSIRIRERANIERAGERIFADSVVYDSESRFFTAYGKSKLINAKGEEVDSEEGPFFYHTDRRIGTVVNGRTQWEVWNVAGNFTLEGSDTLWVKSGLFTSCELPEPHYHFASDRIKLILGHIVVAWPVRLYFGDVPVFWFPFMAQDIRRGRHSGILTPRFGLNDVVRNSTGYNRHLSNIGYYWAINDYMDAQLGLDWWSSTWTRVDGFFRYRWRQRFLNGRLGYSQFFLPEGGRQTSLVWGHSQKFGERADLRASVQFVSSRTFQRQNEFNPERLVQQLRSDVGFSRRFDWGSLNLSGQRVQPLTEGGQTTTQFPQLSLTLAPIVLTPARSPLEARWYHGLTWTGSTNLGYQTTEIAGQPKQASRRAALNSGWSLGNMRWNSSGNYQESIIDKPDTLFAAPDTTIVGGDTAISVDTLVIGPKVREGRLGWQTSLGYQQRLIGSTTLTPSVDLNGTLFRSNETNLDFVSGPTRVSARATLNSDLYGFLPGVGPLERIRHKLSPSFSWSYSPAVKPSAEVAALRGFGAGEASERHRLTIGLNQTFEAKLKPRAADRDAEAGEVDTTDVLRPIEPRKITLLAIRTSAITYDFVEGEVTTDRLSNNITSDLLRGLTVRLQHDLFEELEGGRRRFDPFLVQLNLGFSLGSGTVAGLFGDPSSGVRRGRGILPEARELGDLEEEEGMLEEEEPQRRPGRRPQRTWNLSVDYSLVRQRPLPDREPSPTRQSIRGNLAFSPTENWNLTWRTQYDVEEGEFVDHALSLRRDLHRWSATFQFLRAANRNFLFEFRVDLNDLRDIKFDYRQESRRSSLQ